MARIQNARFNATGGIDMQVEHPVLGWIPYTAREDDVENRQALWDLARQSNPEPFVEISPEDALEEERSAMNASRFQLKAALQEAGKLSAFEDALGAAAPVSVLAWAEAASFRRNSPSITELATASGLTDEELDEVFRRAAEIEA